MGTTCSSRPKILDGHSLLFTCIFLRFLRALSLNLLTGTYEAPRQFAPVHGHFFQFTVHNFFESFRYMKFIGRFPRTFMGTFQVSPRKTLLQIYNHEVTNYNRKISQESPHKITKCTPPPRS